MVVVCAGSRWRLLRSCCPCGAFALWSCCPSGRFGWCVCSFPCVPVARVAGWVMSGPLPVCPVSVGRFVVLRVGLLPVPSGLRRPAVIALLLWPVPALRGGLARVRVPSVVALPFVRLGVPSIPGPSSLVCGPLVVVFSRGCPDGFFSLALVCPSRFVLLRWASSWRSCWCVGVLFC